MKPENEAIFRNNYHHWQTLRDAFYLRGLNVHEKDNLLRAAREEFFGPGYSPDMFCGSCLANMVKDIYKRFDDWESQQPIIVKTGFPSNK